MQQSLKNSPAYAEHVQAGDTTAIIFALKNAGEGSRIMEAKLPPNPEISAKIELEDKVELIIGAIRKRTADKGVSFEAETRNFLGNFTSKLPTKMREAVEKAAEAKR